MKTITVEIDENGSTKVETKGFAGKACQDATKALHDALGCVVNDQTTPEYHQQSRITVGQKGGQ